MANENETLEEERSMKLFVVLTRTLEAIKKKIEKDIRSHGLNPTEFAVMEVLYSKGDQPVQKIGEKVLIASSSITYVVDKLEKRGYTTRRRCPQDRRVTFVTLTETGYQFLDDIFPDHRKAISEIMGGLSTEEKDALIKQLKKLGVHAQEL
ncbi:MarR family winged helix-turn-helix transcriptional regulator [Shouchella shacheensis]|uniref:MarR family winged helix-turn-helix transcriptional regulator n=1 Tax=Shouchella shacheensis TaxID=1649580 RepID=UPI00074014C4|nr:MarR family transcriptional regulator [Shouchella shacheensis]